MTAFRTHIINIANDGQPIIEAGPVTQDDWDMAEWLLAEAAHAAEHWMGMAVYEIALRYRVRDERDAAIWLLAEADRERSHEP